MESNGRPLSMSQPNRNTKDLQEGEKSVGDQSFVTPKASEFTIKDKKSNSSDSPRSFNQKQEQKTVFAKSKQFRQQYNPRAVRLEKERLRNQRK